MIHKSLFMGFLMFHLGICTPTTTFAQSTRAVELSASELHQVHADDGTLYLIYIAFPLGYQPDGDVKYPVLYMTDPTGLFALVAQAMRVMELDEELPPMILVGFEKPANSLPETLMNRYFDLTPTHDPKREKDLLEAFGREIPTGGADALLAVLKDKIVPVDTPDTTHTELVVQDSSALFSDAVSALINLGYPKNKAEKTVRSCLASQRGNPITLGELIKHALDRMLR